MNDSKYRYTLYLIVFVIICTIAIQVYWNYKNYIFNKQQLVKDVQISLDKAVDDYYAELAEKTTQGFVFQEHFEDSVSNNKHFFEKLSKSIKKQKKLDTVKSFSIQKLEVFKSGEKDSLLHNNATDKWISLHNSNNILKVSKQDSVYLHDIKQLTSKVIISLNNNSLNIRQIDSLLKADLNRKKIAIDYFLDYKKTKLPETFTNKPKDSVIDKKITFLSATSQSFFLPKNSVLSIYFKNINSAVFSRIFLGIFMSTLLVLAVISCLFYLLKIIQKQKQLAEVKNDLISNITHEFKTPIATIGAALESISNFNVIDDKEKTKLYLNMSSNQLLKLHLMVEKLLETATLDSESLELNKESKDIVALLELLVNRYQLEHQEKTFKTAIKIKSLMLFIDAFHFENALNNILDNAVKYGGDSIFIELFSTKKSVEILLSDTGNTLDKDNKNRIFEKFYRIPKGNKHDVKGFGIGLYYTKSIIEKHGGSIEVVLNNKRTTFKILLPNG